MGTERGARISRTRLGEVELVALSVPIPRRPADLSAAERAILALLLSGLSLRAIAAARGRSLATVSKQVASLYRKVGVASRRDLLARFA